MPERKFVKVRGAHPLPLPGRSIRPEPEERFRVTLVLKWTSQGSRRRQAALNKLTAIPVANRDYWSDADLEQKLSSAPGQVEQELAAIRKFADDFGLGMMATGSPFRSVDVEGSARQLEAAFQIDMCCTTGTDERLYSHEGQVRLPEEVAGSVEIVLGLENLPRCDPHRFHCIRGAKRICRGGPKRFERHRYRSDPHLEPTDLYQRYSFPPPAELNGSGQKIAIIVLGGGFYKRDLQKYFSFHGARHPRVRVVNIYGSENNPAPRKEIQAAIDSLEQLKNGEIEEPVKSSAQVNWTIETTMDIQLVGRMCPGAEITVYFAPNDLQGQYQAFSVAMSDHPHQADIITCSWGSLEDSSTRGSRECRLFDRLFQDAALKGITVCFSSGDHGANTARRGKPVVQFPACCPHVLACGGTMFIDNNLESGEEVVWSEELSPAVKGASGGGVSAVFALPGWQKNRGIGQKTGGKVGRSVPDVAGKADLENGFCMFVAGRDVAMGGTSAVAPIWAGLLGLINKRIQSRVGYLNPLLYSHHFLDAVQDIQQGNNGTFQAWPGWDACTGLGSPNWQSLLEAIESL